VSRIVLIVDGQILLDTGAGSPVITPTFPPDVIPAPLSPYGPTPILGGLLPGHGERFLAGKSRFEIRDLQAGTELELSVSDSNGSIRVRVIAPSGGVLDEWVAPNLGTRRYSIVFPGTYTVEIDADAPGKISHWRN